MPTIHKKHSNRRAMRQRTAKGTNQRNSEEFSHFLFKYWSQLRGGHGKNFSSDGIFFLNWSRASHANWNIPRAVMLVASLIDSERLIKIKIKNVISSLNHCFFHGVWREMKLFVIARSFTGPLIIMRTLFLANAYLVMYRVIIWFGFSWRLRPSNSNKCVGFASFPENYRQVAVLLASNVLFLEMFYL